MPQVALISIGNSVQSYLTLHYTQRVYTPPLQHPKALNKPATPSQVTPLSARTFGTWTFLTSIVRLYAAYHINEPAFYSLAHWTYGIAWMHFMSEWWVYRTTSWGTPLAGPVCVASGSLLWMFLQRDFYVG